MPMDLSLSLPKPSTKENDSAKQLPSGELIGCLMHFAVQKRPDIAYSASRLMRFSSTFEQRHWKTAKQVAKYLNSTKQWKLRYTLSNDYEIRGYSDAD